MKTLEQLAKEAGFWTYKGTICAPCDYPITGNLNSILERFKRLVEENAHNSHQTDTAPAQPEHHTLLERVATCPECKYFRESLKNTPCHHCSIENGKLTMFVRKA